MSKKFARQERQRQRQTQNLCPGTCSGDNMNWNSETLKCEYTPPIYQAICKGDNYSIDDDGICRYTYETDNFSCGFDDKIMKCSLKKGKKIDDIVPHSLDTPKECAGRIDYKFIRGNVERLEFECEKVGLSKCKEGYEYVNGRCVESWCKKNGGEMDGDKCRLDLSSSKCVLKKEGGAILMDCDRNDTSDLKAFHTDAKFCGNKGRYKNVKVSETSFLCMKDLYM